MKTRVKILGAVIALCTWLATGPGLAQQDAPPTSRDVPQSSGGADGVTIKGLVIPGGSDGGRTRPSPPLAGDGREGAVMTNGGIDPVRPEGGSPSLRRRANLRAVIANPPKMPTGSPASNTRIGPPLARPGAEGGTARNAIGIVVPGGGQGPGHAFPGSTAPGIGARGPANSTFGVGIATGNVSHVDPRQSAVPPNVVTSPVAHTSGINGTTMGHIASGPSYIGGPAKDTSGINGTAVRPRH